MIVSKIMQNPDATDPAPVEGTQYYYHADQLGSTNYVTDANGNIFRHLEYFPSGETWVDEHSNTHPTPYLFTGQQFDDTTDLYYEQSRYYDPRTSVWQSGDPLLSSDPHQAIIEPDLLDAYSYVGDNPVNYVDPSGLGKQKKRGIYVLVKNGKVVRSGRSNDLKRRKAEHARAFPGTTFVRVFKVAQTETDEERGLEEIVYNKFQNTAILNKVRGINLKNKKRTRYLRAAKNWLKTNAVTNELQLTTFLQNRGIPLVNASTGITPEIQGL
jgi:RHS repeat-associated protein